MIARYRTIALMLVLAILAVGCRAIEATPIPPTATPIAGAPAESATQTPTDTPTPPATATVAPTPPTPTATPAGEPEGVVEELRPDAGGLIAFVSDRDGNTDIYVVGADGDNLQRLTNSRQWDYFPTWSPDGAQIAFYTHLTDFDWVIQVMDADGSNLRQLTDNHACDGAPYWSPDGGRIAFTSAPDCDPNNREIVVMDADGSDQRQLTNNDADDYLSAWSPDGQQIAFTSDRDGNDEIYVMNADGSDPRRLTDSPGHDHMPAWAPDGERIAFVSDRTGNDEIYAMDINGENVGQLTDHPSSDWFPFWSPDGQQIVFNSRRDGNLEVYVMTAGGESVRRLTNHPANDFNAVWQPLATPSSGPSTWIRTYEGDPISAAFDAVPSGDGGYLLVGATNHTHQDAADEDVHLMKIDAAGEVLWEKTYGGDRFDRGKAILPSADGGFAILAETESSGAGGRDIYLLQVDADGYQVWSQTYGGLEMERANALQQTADGGYLLLGSTESSGAGGKDVYLVKTDGAGTELWSQTYGDEVEEEGLDLVPIADGGFLVLAEKQYGEGLYTAQNPDVYLLQVDGWGTEVWSRVWEEEGVQGGFRLLSVSDGNYLMTGFFSPTGRDTDTDFLFVKIDGEGNVIWSKPLGNQGAFDYGSDVIETSDGGYLLTGVATEGPNMTAPLIKTDAKGDPLWRRDLFAGSRPRAGTKVLEAPDGGYLVVVIPFTSGRFADTAVIKTDAEGNVEEE